MSEDLTPTIVNTKPFDIFGLSDLIIDAGIQAPRGLFKQFDMTNHVFFDAANVVRGNQDDQLVIVGFHHMDEPPYEIGGARSVIQIDHNRENPTIRLTGLCMTGLTSLLYSLSDPERSLLEISVLIPREVKEVFKLAGNYRTTSVPKYGTNDIGIISSTLLANPFEQAGLKTMHTWKLNHNSRNPRSNNPTISLESDTYGNVWISSSSDAISNRTNKPVRFNSIAFPANLTPVRPFYSGLTPFRMNHQES